jgi:hypothetical protein
MNVKVQNWILKRVQNDTLVMPNQVLNLLQDLTISASHLSFGFDLTFELWHLTFPGEKNGSCL